MNSYRFLPMIAGVLVLAGISAHAQTMPAQDNTWVTGNGAQIDFSNFGNVNLTQVLGSAPTNSVVTFSGVPLSSQLGSADTIVTSSQVDVTSGTNRATLTLQALSMASNPNLTVQDGRVFHVTVSLAHSGSGYADFTRTAGTDGGTYDSSFTVTPILTFTNVNNSSDVHTVDCSQSANTCSFSMTVSGGNLVLSSSTGFDPMSLGIPTVPSGVQVGGYTTIGRSRYNAIYPGVVHGSSGYSVSPNNEVENAGSSWHKPNPPTDCKSTSTTSSTTRTNTPSGSATLQQQAVAICAVAL
jgi:hypothetical protein